MKDRQTLLIVDDDPGARETLEALLIPEGHEMEFAENGEEGLKKVPQVMPDLILLDVMMPDIDGFEVCRQIKKQKDLKHIPIILVTALNSRQDMIDGLEAGADEFLSKPVRGAELRARVRSMLRIKRQYDELLAALQLREDMAGMIVHDMKNPLTSIMGYGELLRLSIPEEMADMVDKIIRDSERMNGMLNDMLMLAKLESGKPLLSPSPVDMNQLIRQAGAQQEVITSARRLHLSVETPAQSRHIYLDQKLFLRVLDNLISNAIKFSAKDDTVTIRLTYPGDNGFRLEVADNGPGIAPEHRDRVFDKFEIIKLKQDGVPQVGLGLALCKLVVDAHGGTISVGENRPRGTVFTIEM